MMSAIALAVAAAASAPATHEVFIDKEGCRWVRKIAPAKPKVARKPAPAASAASAPAKPAWVPAKPRKPLKLWKEPESDWQPINCNPPAEDEPAPFSPVPDEPVPPTFERVAAPPPETPVVPPSELLAPPECDCFAGGPPVYYPPTFTTYPPPVYNPPVYVPPGVAVTPVPEPSIIYLLGAGFAAIVFIRRRRPAQ